MKLCTFLPTNFHEAANGINSTEMLFEMNKLDSYKMVHNRYRTSG
ncbi:hypothetical protein VIBNIAM115_290014 [Vibrio nigripulchritudo AM115]|nr:hypothetical protein VIBNIAM115_290014 [Vibrio nigripulchritudo AM115]